LLNQLELPRNAMILLARSLKCLRHRLRKRIAPYLLSRRAIFASTSPYENKHVLDNCRILYFYMIFIDGPDVYLRDAITGNCSLPRVEDRASSQRYNVSFDEYKNGSKTDRRQWYDEPEVALHFTFSSKEEHFTHDLVVRFSCSHGSRFP